MADQEESSQRAPPMWPPPSPPPSPAILEEEESSQRAPPMSPPPPPPPSPAILEEEESSQSAPPISPPPPPPPSPANLEDSSSEAIPWADTDDCSSSTPHTDLLSLWLSNYTAQLPQPKAEEELLEDVPTLQNFDLESSFPDLVDWNTTSTTVTQSPVVTQPLWVQLHTPIGGEVDDVSGQALRIQSPKPSILPLALGIEFPEASISPLALGIQPPPSSVEMIQSPQASISPLALGIQPPQTSFGIETQQASSGIETPQASLSPLALGIQSPQTSFGIQSAAASFSSLPSNISSTLPITPPVGIFLPGPSPGSERRSWSVFLSTPPPAWRYLLLPHSASSSVSVPSSHPSHQTHHFLPAANTGHQQEVPVAHAPVTFSTPNANANSFAGFVPASQPSWSQAMASCGSWIPNQPWISNGQEMKLPIPRRPQFLVPPVAATTPEPPPLLANFGSSVGNMPNCNGEEDVPVEGHQRAQTGESSRRSRKRSKLAVRTDKKLFK